MSVDKLITDHIDIWSSALQTRSTAGRGSRGKIDLYGIKKLRELILELAVRGKLVPQDPNDEPASELLKRIAAEKVDLVKQGKIKKQKQLPEISEDEKPFELPEGWEWCRLPDISNYQVGKTPPSKDNSYWDINGTGIPWVSIADLNHNGYVSSTAKMVTDKAKNISFSYPPVKAGTILMSFKLTVGKVSILEIDAFHNEAIISINHHLGIEKKYLFSVLPLISKLGRTKQAIMGNTLNSESLSMLLLPIPSQQEQIRIISKYEELMSLCDQLEQQSLTSLDAHQQLVETLLATLTNSQDAEELAENWARISQHFDTLFTTEASIDALRKTILQLAVMGLLIESAEFSQRSHLKKHLSFGPRNGLSPSEVKYETDVKVLKLGATSYGYLKLQETKYVDVDTSDKLHLFLRKGDILIQRGNSSNFVGCSLLIEKDFDNLIYPDLMMKIRTKDELFPEYAALWLSSPFSRNYMWSKMTGTSGTMPKISKKVVEDVPIAVPPLAIQHQLVVKIKEFFFLCDSLKSRLQLAQQTQLHLADALTDAALS
ncbi:restriction endonuclease subunit S [Erwinia sp. 1181_3]|uniref:restriction endonuclease subunit S n=1 Tax=Erwinia sp. 1181_3 TaxID=2605957 RepID=UPI0040590D25